MTPRDQAARDQTAGEPRFTVVSGQPSAEELAALTVALSAVLARSGEHPGPVRAASGWADRRTLLGAPPAPGPGAWRRSARPH